MDLRWQRTGMGTPATGERLHRALASTAIMVGVLAPGFSGARAGVTPPPVLEEVASRESEAAPHEGIAEAFMLRGAGEVGPNCVTSECHTGHLDHRYMHGPLFVSACYTCHTMKGDDSFTIELSRPIEKLCVFCHTEEIPENSLAHEPFEAGACVSCHTPHGSNDPSLMRLEHYSDLCLSCHEDLIGARNLVHGPAADGACSACHEPHMSTNRKLLTADGRGMCLECHAEIENQIETSRVVHDPVKTDCQLCHDPHATDNPSMLVSTPGTLCMSCHEDIRHEVGTASTSHGAVVSERACLNCHAPHASDHQRLLKGDVMGLCFECHDKQIELENGTTLTNMKQLIESGTTLHAPVAEGNCVQCHEIHGGDRERLLVREYPNAKYGQFEKGQFALCFGCHDSAMVSEAQTGTVTRFRNGTRNLHTVHVNRGNKGRSCSLCHDTHASNKSQHIRETVPFGPGGWDLPIRYKQTADGGSCASGCHDGLSYSRTNPVFYPPWTEKKD